MLLRLPAIQDANRPPEKAQPYTERTAILRGLEKAMFMDQAGRLKTGKEKTGLR
jgi:hypothetical protein